MSFEVYACLGKQIENLECSVVDNAWVDCFASADPTQWQMLHCRFDATRSEN